LKRATSLKKGTEFWSPPDPALAAAGADGEWFVAKVRLAAVAVLLGFPSVLGLGVSLLVVAAAVAMAWVVRTRARHPAIGFVSSALDVSLATTVLVASNSNSGFELYFLAIAAATLRYDPRISVFAGTLAIVEYAGFRLWSGGDAAIEPLLRPALLAVAALLSFAMVRRALRLQDVSTKDAPTGVSNRLHFDRALEVEVARALRQDRPMALAILSVDPGAPAGDRVLRELGARLTAGLRRTDVVARHGPDELVVLMAETTSAQATGRIDQLRRVIAGEPVDLGGGFRVIMNFSAGVAGMSGTHDRIRAATLLDRADAKLLAAKQAGGGCVLSDEPER
jgi:diguanylate cyclase (GGDEF)-like protein